MRTPNLMKMKHNELLKIRRALSERSDYFHLSLPELCKFFLQNFTAVDLTGCAFAEVREIYIAQARKQTNAPLEEHNFYSFLAKHHLGLDEVPGVTFVKILTTVTSDLAEIKGHITYIDSELVRLNNLKRTTRLSGAQRYYKYQLDFYRERNIKARAEIVDFLSADIKAFVVSRSQKQIFKSIFSSALPYKYSQMRMFSGFFNSYDVTALNDMSNKFLELPMQIQKGCHETHQKNPEEFFNFAKGYIDQEEPPGTIARIKAAILESHILFRRKKTIETILGHYARGDYLSFVNMAPLQIEGIFHDICLEVGVKQADLDVSSINDKLNRLEPLLGYSLQYEYYAFKFPVIRNAVAHGELIEDGLEQTAMMLMLDFGPVCDLTLDSHIPLNVAIELVKVYAATKEPAALAKWLSYLDVVIPGFYGLEDDVRKMILMYEAEEFWDFLRSGLEDDSDVTKSQAITLISKLKNKGIAVKQCKKFLASVSSLR